MKLMIYIKVSKEEAEKFLDRMISQGYTSHVDDCSNKDRTFYYFKIDGQISPDYSVNIFGDECLIGIRPQ